MLGYNQDTPLCRLVPDSVQLTFFRIAGYGKFYPVVPFIFDTAEKFIPAYVLAPPSGTKK
jgi:hypothetical protein